MRRIPVSAVIFDLDGTISDSARGILGGYERVLAGLGLDGPSDGDWRDYLGPPLRELMRNRHGLDDDQLDRAAELYLDYYGDTGVYEAEVYDGIVALLDGLRDRDVTLAIATSKRRWLAERVLDHYGLRERFAVIEGAHDDGSGGVKHDVVGRVLARLDPPEGASVVMVGDRDSDLLAGVAHGASAIGVGWGYARHGELEAIEGAELVASVADLEARLLGR
jgi:phosphoglycolate phosphatase